MPDDVFNFHNGVINQHAGHKTERQQRHGVERETQKVQKPKGRNGGQGNGNRRNNCGAPIAQEQEHDDDGKQRAFDHRGHRAFILTLRVIHTVEQSDEFDSGIFLFDFGDLDHRIIKNGDVGRPFGSRHAESDNLLATCKGHGALLAEPIGDFSHIGQFDGASTAQADLCLAQCKCVRCVAQNADRLA